MSRGVAQNKKDAEGLTAEDRQLLQEIAIRGSWQQAADSLGLTHTQVSARFRNKAFKSKYDELFGGEQIEITKRELVNVARLVGKTYEDILSAEKDVPVTVVCPDCGQTITTRVKVIDYATRRQAAADVAKQTGIWKDSKSLSIEQTTTNISVSLTGSDWIYIERLRRGLPIPGSIYSELENKTAGSDIILPPNPVTEGSYRLVEENDDETDSVPEQ